MSEFTRLEAGINTALETKLWFEKAIPNPTAQNISTQFGVHAEEFAEMLEQMTPQDEATGDALRDALVAVTHLATHMKSNAGCVTVEPDNRVELIDSVADQLVTGIGIGHVLAMDPIGALNEVNRSNYSKFVDGQPIFNENMKVQKGPDYTKPDLALFV